MLAHLGYRMLASLSDKKMPAPEVNNAEIIQNNQWYIQKMKTPPKPVGRPRATSLSAITTPLSEFIDANWGRTGLTNDEAAARLGFKSANLVSMWRTGRTPIPLARLGQLAQLLEVDLMLLFVLWLKQERLRNLDVSAELVEQLEARLATANEATLLRSVRTATKNADPAFDHDQVRTACRALT